MRALEVGERVYGPEDAQVAIRSNNLGQILQDKGDVEGAQRYAERAEDRRTDVRPRPPQRRLRAIIADVSGLELLAWI